MDADKLFAGIALLIDLAQKGEIDPWDVQVIEVIDRYLIKLLDSQDTPSAYETDLSQSGQAFLSASMLVLFKANTLSALELNPIEEDFASDDNLLAFAEAIGKGRSHHGQHLRRRSAAVPPQKRAVTLLELIAQLQLMAQTSLTNQDYAKPSRRSRDLRLASRAQITRATLELAHQENLTEVAGKLEQFLTGYCQESHGQNWLNLDQLVHLWNQETTSKTSSTPLSASLDLPDNSHTQTTNTELVGDRVSVFWALLLLSAQSKVELEQAEFYQEIKIRITAPVIGEFLDEA